MRAVSSFETLMIHGVSLLVRGDTQSNRTIPGRYGFQAKNGGLDLRRPYKSKSPPPLSKTMIQTNIKTSDSLLRSDPDSCRTRMNDVMVKCEEEITNSLFSKDVFSPPQLIFHVGWMQMDEEGASNNDATPLTSDGLTTEVEEVVEFTGAVQPIDSTVSFSEDLARKFYRQVGENRTHTVVDFLSRPYLVGSTTWSNTQTANSVLAQYEFPNALLRIPGVRHKLEGFTFLRAGMTLRIVTNAQPFQQGRLLVYFSPYLRDLNKDTGYSLSSRTSERTLLGSTGFPRVELDLGNASEATLTIPYVSPYSAFSLMEDLWSVGSFVVKVYSPLAGGTDSVAVSFWAYFNDPEPTIPTCAPIYELDPPTSFTRGRVQINLKAEAAKGEGTVTTLANTVGKVATLASAVPALTPIAAPVAAVASVASKVASIFGFSKPKMESLVTATTLAPGRYQNNYDGNDASKSLGLTFKNQIGVQPVFGTSADEMAIAYIAQKANYVRTIPWSTTVTPGTILADMLCHPFGDTWDVHTDLGVGTRQFPYVGYVCMPFELWRGTLVYTFKLVKTSFHAGRLRFGIIPKGKFAEGNYDLNFVYQKIVDIQGTDEVTIEVPFVYELPWCQVPDVTTVYPIAPTVLTVEVLTSLRRPNELVSDTVQILVEVAGGEDFEVARPRTIDYCIERPTFESKSRPALQMQYETNGFGGNFINDDDSRFETVGETVASFKQLLLRQQHAGFSTEESPNAECFPLQVASDLTHEQGVFDVLLPLYAFWRGSFRLKSYSLAESTNVTTMTRLNAYVSKWVIASDPCYRIFGTFTERLWGSPFALTREHIEGMNEVEVPYYACTYMKPTNNWYLTAEALFRFAKLGAPNVTIFPSGDGGLQLFRAVGDDFRCGFLTGSPILRIGEA